MKKYFYLLALLSTFINAQLYDYYVPSKKNNITQDDLKGNVKYMNTVKWKMVVKFGDPTKERYLEKQEIFYNKDGITEKQYNFHERFEGKSVYTYIYDKKDEILEMKILNRDRSTSNITFIYNTQNQLTERNVFDVNSKLRQKDKYKYESGKLASITKYTGDGKFDGMKKFFWDEKGNMISEYLYGKSEEPIKLIDYGYDTNRNVSSQDEASGDLRGIYYRSNNTFFYNANNKRIKKTNTFNNKKSIVDTIYTYDSQGNIIKEEYYDAYNKTYKTIHQYTYVYDNVGNWLSKLTEYEEFNEKAYLLVERDIKYY